MLDNKTKGNCSFGGSWTGPGQTFLIHGFLGSWPLGHWYRGATQWPPLCGHRCRNRAEFNVKVVWDWGLPCLGRCSRAPNSFCESSHQSQQISKYHKTGHGERRRWMWAPFGQLAAAGRIRTHTHKLYIWAIGCKCLGQSLSLDPDDRGMSWSALFLQFKTVTSSPRLKI